MLGNQIPTSENISILDLPPEIICKILSFLSHEDIANTRLVCNKFKAMADYNRSKIHSSKIYDYNSSNLNGISKIIDEIDGFLLFLLHLLIRPSYYEKHYKMTVSINTVKLLDAILKLINDYLIIPKSLTSTYGKYKNVSEYNYKFVNRYQALNILNKALTNLKSGKPPIDDRKYLANRLLTGNDILTSVLKILLGIKYLPEANLRGANLGWAKLRGANLRWANLYKAYLQRANLQGAKLQDADLRRADLRGANLSEAKLQRAKLQRANLLEANLRGADFTEATVCQSNYNFLKSVEQHFQIIGYNTLQVVGLQNRSMQYRHLPSITY